MCDLPKHLMIGYQIFNSNLFEVDKKHYKKLADQGQKPETMIISCCDSRVNPEAIFNSKPGKLFIFRNVANIVPKYEPSLSYETTSTAIEFGVQSLKVKNIVVLGHEKCGGIKAALDTKHKPLSEGNFVKKWTDLILPIKKTTLAKSPPDAILQLELELASIRQSWKNLRTFPFIRDLEEQKKLSLHAAWFEISRGKLWTMKPENGDFLPIS